MTRTAFAAGRSPLSVPNALDFLITPDCEAEKKRMADNYHTVSRRGVPRLYHIKKKISIAEKKKEKEENGSDSFRSGAFPAYIT